MDGYNIKIAVTGGMGFIGNYLVKELLKNKHDVLVMDIRKGKMPEGAELRITDVTDLNQTVHELSDVDIIYHLAGTVLNTARKDPYLAAHLDILGTANILEACRKNDVEKVMYASSFYAYDGLPTDIEVDETHYSDIFKAEMFGVVKLFGERLIHEYNHRYNLKYVILRYGPAYGPNNRCTCIIYDFIKAGLCGQPFIVWGPGKRKNQYTYVEDIAKGNVAALPLENEVLNIISPECVSIKQIAELLTEKYGFKIQYDLNRREGPTMPYMSPKKTMDKLNWKPISLEEGIKRTIDALAPLIKSTGTLCKHACKDLQ